jgi:hypothetical protein
MSFLLDSLKKQGVAGTVDHLFQVRSEETTGEAGRDAWYVNEAKKNSLESSIGYLSAAAAVEVDVDDFLRHLQVPTLLLTGTEFSSLITVEGPGILLTSFPAPNWWFSRASNSSPW